MLSPLLLRTPTHSAPALDLRLISSHPSSSPATFFATSVCSSTAPRRPRPLSAVQSLPHPSNSYPLYGQRLPLPPASSTKRGSPTPSAASSPPSADPGLWDSLTAAVAAIPTPVLIAIAAAVAVYAVSRVFSSPGPAARERAVSLPSPPPPPPIQLGEVTEDELRQYDGSDPQKPLLMAIKGQIYDVSQSRLFYGPGGPYALFTGKDASRALAKMSFEEKDLTGDVSGLGPFELSALQDWEYKFNSKYVVVGTVKKPDALVTDAVSASAAAEGGNGSVIVGDIIETKEAAAVSQDDVLLEEGSSPEDGTVQAAPVSRDVVL